MEKISVEKMRFVDFYGRERIFNGVNICDKGINDETDVKKKYTYSYPQQMYDYLAAHGFNIVRLGITWAAIEPEPEQYNDEYIQAVRVMMDELHKRGIYVYLDMHQDLFSGNIYQWGDGAPYWACLSDGHPYKKISLVWAEGYFWGKGVHACFDNFWANKDCLGKGILDRFADMWAYVAEKLGDHPALFGFDMFNEPYLGKDGGRVFRKIVAKAVSTTLTDKRIKFGKLIKSAVKADLPAILEQYNGDVLKKIVSVGADIVADFDRKRYTPFLNKTAAAIREKTQNGIMFIDNCYYSNMSIPCKAGPIVCNGKREEKSCYSPHGYDLFVDTPLYRYADNSRIDAIFGEHAAVQQRLEAPVMVGEWGGHYGGDTLWHPHLHHILRFFDEHKWSNTYWCFYEGLMGDPVIDLLDRPYPQAVSGNIERYEHSREDNSFTLEYRQDDFFAEPTLVYLPSLPKAVSCTGDYKINLREHGNGCVLEMRTGTGKHSLRVEL